MKCEIPLDEDLVARLIPFWASFFGAEHVDLEAEVFLGSEISHNCSTLYFEERDATPVSTCVTVRSRSVPALAGFAEVATDPAFRGRGLATALCTQAGEDFRDSAGEAFFLGTVNPQAARIYHRLGWRRLAGSSVMLNVSSGASPEEFLVDYFRKPGDVTVIPAGAAMRIPMIPLIWTPHDDQVMDANVGLHSLRHEVQSSCMGLYPRYVRALQRRGMWFAACTDDGRVVGLSSALLEGDSCRVDGFVHRNFHDAWQSLLAAASNWGRDAGANRVGARVSVEDEEKLARFEEIRFENIGSGDLFQVGGREVASVLLTRSDR